MDPLHDIKDYKNVKTPGGTKLPTNINEFMEYAQMRDWPFPVEESEYNLQVSPDKVINRNLIVTKLLQAAPLSLAGFGVLRKQLADFDNKVNDLAQHFITEKALVPLDQQTKRTFFAPPKTFLTEIAESEIVKSLAGAKKNSQKALTEGEEVPSLIEERCTNVLKAQFPGVRIDAPTDLPNWIELPGIVDKVAQTVDVQSSLRAMWRQIYLSQASIVLIQDGFWWFFLDYFKNSDEDAIIAKEAFFDRMADTYVTLFFSIDRSVRDKFMQVYTTIVTQSIFLCFADAFPDSQYLYDDAFKNYLADCVSLWLQGVKAVPNVYKTWAVNSMLKADQIEAERKQRQANMVFDPSTLDAAIAQLGPMQLPMTGRKSVRIASTAGLPPEHSPLQARPSATPSVASVIPPPKGPTRVRESLPIGPGAHIERVKFRLTGNSQLMDHHMRMHGVPIVQGPLAVRSQEKNVPQKATQTYADLIKQSKKALKDMEKHLANMEKETQDEMARIRRQYAADTAERRELQNPKADGKKPDLAKLAAMEVREMMKQAIKTDASAAAVRSGDEEDLAANLALGL